MSSTEATNALRAALTALEAGNYPEAARLAKLAKSRINQGDLRR